MFELKLHDNQQMMKNTEKKIFKGANIKNLK